MVSFDSLSYVVYILDITLGFVLRVSEWQRLGRMCKVVYYRMQLSSAWRNIRIDISNYTVPADLSDVFQCDIQQRRGLASGQVLASCRSTTFVSRLHRIISTKRKAVQHTLERVSSFT